MIEIFLKLVNHQALDEWNERTIAIFVLFLLGDFLRRIAGRIKFRVELTNVAKKWVKHREEAAVARGDSSAGKPSNLKANPHPQLNVLLDEFIDEFHEFRREIRNEIDESLRNHRREARAELDEEVKLIRQKLSELN